MRQTELRRKTPIRRGKKPIARLSRLPLTNAERRAKREREKRRKYARFRKSPGRKAALERAGGRCEMLLLNGERCPKTAKLTVHHRTYSRFGGKELPTDLVVLCKGHHDKYESIHRGYRAANRKRTAA